MNSDNQMKILQFEFKFILTLKFSSNNPNIKKTPTEIAQRFPELISKSVDLHGSRMRSVYH